MFIMIVINIFNINQVSDYDMSDEHAAQIAAQYGMTFEYRELRTSGCSPKEALYELDLL